MKKKFFKLAGLLLCTVMAFSFAACGNNDENTDGPENPNGPGNTEEPQFSDRVEEIGRLMTDGINAMLEQPYFTFDIATSFAEDSSEGAVPDSTDMTINVKKTDKGYDMVGSSVSSYYAQNDMAPGLVSENTEYYLTDGVLLSGHNEEKGGTVSKTEYENEYIGDLSEYIRALPGAGIGAVIKKMDKDGSGVEDALNEANFTKEQAIRLLSGVLTHFSQVEKTESDTSIKAEVDLTSAANFIINWIKTNADESIADVLMNISELDQASLTAEIEKLFAEGLTVAEFAERLDGFMATVLGLDLTVGKIFDVIEVTAGISNEKMGDLVKNILLNYGMEEQDVSKYIVQPEEGQSFYEYVLACVGEQKVDDVVSMVIESPSANTGTDEAEAQPTLRDIGDKLLDFLFPSEGEALTVKEALNNLTTKLDLFGYEVISQLEFKTVKATATIGFDEQGRLTGIDGEVLLRMTGMGEEGEESYLRLKCDVAVSYPQTAPEDVTFGFPDGVEVLPVPELSSKMLLRKFEAERTESSSSSGETAYGTRLAVLDKAQVMAEGLTFGIFTGRNTGTFTYSISYGAEHIGADAIYAEDGTTLYGKLENNTVTLTPEFFEYIVSQNEQVEFSVKAENEAKTIIWYYDLV